MTDGLDTALRALAARPAHPGLQTIDGEVLARIACVANDRPANNAFVAAIIAALLVGAAASILPESPDRRAQTAIDSGLNLAPSTLLVGS